MVLVVVAFLGILSAMLMFASYGGYQMKLVDKQVKDNFYTVEMVLDEINVGLQEAVSESLSKAYQEVMQNYALYESPAKRNQALYDLYYTDVQTKFDGQVSTLIGFLSADSKGNGNGTRSGFNTYGAIVESTSGVSPDEYSTDLEENKGLLLKGIEVTYVDQRGNVAIISTDIRIGMPQINFSESSAFPELNHYSLIADGTVQMKNRLSNGKVNVKGNVYAGEMKIDRPDVTDLSVEVSFERAEDEAADQQALVVCKEDIAVEDSSITTTDTELWASNLLLDTSNANLAGSTYIKNDLKLEGVGSSATLAGTYTGFGTSAYDSAKSSAILINGRDSSLDLSNLEGLNIGGRGYVGTAYKTGDSNEHGEEAENTEEIRMGESIAVKSDQLAYLVPAEALACEILEDGTIGDSVFKSNPMKIEQYQQLITHSDKYAMMNINRSIQALGSKTLADYRVSPIPDIIVKYTHAGTLVYFYMSFDTAEHANAYFADYYGLNKETVDKYTSVYVDSIKMAGSDSLLYLNLAGNAMAYNGTEGNLIEATTAPGFDSSDNSINNMFSALHTKLVPTLSQLTPGEQGRSVFENIISVDELKAAVEGAEDASGNPLADPVVFATDSGEKVVLTKGNYEINGGIDSSIRMVIALGDVKVTNDFYGLILAGGDVTVDVADGANLEIELKALTLDDFTKLMMAKDGSGRFYVLDVFRDGINYANSANKMMDYGTKEVSMADLIVYERWSKK